MLGAISLETINIYDYVHTIACCEYAADITVMVKWLPHMYICRKNWATF
jgi:hypothetical protein